MKILKLEVPVPENFEIDNIKIEEVSQSKFIITGYKEVEKDFKYYKDAFIKEHVSYFLESKLYADFRENKWNEISLGLKLEFLNFICKQKGWYFDVFKLVNYEYLLPATSKDFLESIRKEIN